jgi:uncharacterized protein (UPF0335 family)
MHMEAGHNSNAQLKALVERIERVEAEIKDLAEGRKEIYLEAKSNGYDVKALKTIVARRRQDQERLAAHEMLVDTYEAALGA